MATKEQRKVWSARSYERHKARNTERVKTYRSMYPGIKFQNRLKYDFGISVEYYANSRFILQGNKCKICCVELTEPGSVWIEKEGRARFKAKVTDAVVDHCHDTGLVRGILCFKCNKGSYDENPKLLRAAADYFESHIMEKRP